MLTIDPKDYLLLLLILKNYLLFSSHFDAVFKLFFYLHNFFNCFGVPRLVSVGKLEAAVSLLLSTSPESTYFSANALRAIALSFAVSRSLLELAVKVRKNQNKATYALGSIILF